ncbi:MAG: hypothetical protein IAG13_38765 [Deltaproteobacteria bacterium]|nr:hypothetical protein [Nannocystaceae bacterium]
MTPRRLGMIAALCVACGDEPSGTGSSESSGSSSSGEESSSSSTTVVMTTMPPTTTMTTAVDSESSTGEPPCTDPFTQGEFDRYAKYQQEEGAATFFTDIAVIDGDRYLVGASAPFPDEPLAATLFIIGQFEIMPTLFNAPQEDAIVDRLWVDAAQIQSRVFTQNAAGAVEIYNPGDFFNVTGTYQELEAATRLVDVVEQGGVMWAVGSVEGLAGEEWLLARSDDLGATWMMQESFALADGEDAEAHAVAYHPGADAVVITGIASDVGAVQNWHTRVAVAADATESEAIDTVANGNATAVEVLGEAVVVAGDVDGLWRVRMAPSIGAPFEDLDDGTAFDAVKSQVVDLAQGPDGQLFALGTVTDDDQQTLLTLRMCSDISLGAACWTTLVEPLQVFVGENHFPRRLLIDELGVWMVGMTNNTTDELGPEGFVFRFACPS